MKKTQLALIGLVLAMVFGMTNPAYAGRTLVLDVEADLSLFDAVLGDPEISAGSDSLGDVGTVVLYEDDDVKIWEMTLELGEWSDLHHHECDYLLVVDSGDMVAGVMPKGGPMDFFVGKIPEQGNTVRVPKGGTEWAFNVGKKRYHEILIELKKS